MRIVPGAHMGWLTTGELAKFNNKVYPKQTPHFRFKPSKIVQTNPQIMTEYLTMINTLYGTNFQSFQELWPTNPTVLYYVPHVLPPHFIRRERMGREQPLCIEIEEGTGFDFRTMQTRQCAQCNDAECSKVFRLYLRPVFWFMMSNPKLVEQIPFYFTYTTRSKRIMEQIIKAHEVESDLYMLSIRIESGFAPTSNGKIKRDFVRVNAIPMGIHALDMSINISDSMEEIEVEPEIEEMKEVVQPAPEVQLDYDQIVAELMNRGVSADTIAQVVNENGMEGLKALLNSN